MRLLRKLRLRIRSLLLRGSVDDDLEAELSDYLDRERQAAVERGASILRNGRLDVLSSADQQRIKEECREARGISWLDEFRRNLRYGIRILRRNPAFSISAVLTLALGIGTSSTLFSVVDSQLWRPLPFSQPERLVALWESNVKRQSQGLPVSSPDFADWRERNHSFQSIAAMQWPERRNFAEGGFTGRPLVSAVSAEFFETLRRPPLFGRSFTRSNEHPGRNNEAVLSAALAAQAFGSSKASIGREFTLDDLRYVVIGVLAPDFRLDVLRTPDLFIPQAIPAGARDSRNLLVLGRLKDRVTRGEALADMQNVARGIAAEHPDTNANLSVTIANLRDTFVAPATRTWLLLCLAFSLFVLVIACANVATLQLMRSVVRRREFSIRAALGAGRHAIISQAIVENGFLTACGAFIGVLVALASVQLLHGMPLPDLTVREIGVSFNIPSFAFVAATSVVAALTFGLLPGFFQSKVNLENSLRESGRGISGSLGTRHRIAWLTALEIALAFVSLFAAGLFLSSGRNLERASLGFNTQNVLTFEIPLTGPEYRDAKNIRSFYRSALEQVSRIAGVQEAALSNGLPMGPGTGLNFVRTNRPRPEPGSEPYSFQRSVTPGYFHLLSIPLLKGRPFSAQDTEAHPHVAIINQNLARSAFGDEDPLGKSLLLLREDANPPEERVEIIGVAANTREVGLNEVPFSDIYLPISQSPSPSLVVIAKLRDAAPLGPTLRRSLQALDPQGFVSEPKPLGAYVEEQLVSPRFNLALVSIFALFSVVLTAIALFGTLSFAVAQQTREIGVRIALGARDSDIRAFVMHHILLVTATGSSVGLFIAIALGAIFGSRFYLVPHQHDGILSGVSIHDPLSFVSAGLIIAVVACLAAIGPMLRAVRIDPNRALRCE